MSDREDKAAAADLGIDKDVYKGLKEVRRRLLSGQLPHTDGLENLVPDGVYFNMEMWNETLGCGSVCCIGGALEMVIGRRISEREKHLPVLEALFYPPADIDWSAITHLEAADAIDNALNTGRPCWKDVIQR